MCRPPMEKRVVSTQTSISNRLVQPSWTANTSAPITPTHTHKRCTNHDLFYFLGPSLFWKCTPVVPIYIVALTRLLVTHVILSLHYQFVDKDNYLAKLPQKQLQREKDEYCTAFYLHMWVQLGLQIVFPAMFFSDSSIIFDCMKTELLMHVFVVEPLYYFVHRWLHVPEQMKSMHGFHHLSIKTLPTTALVQNFSEHFVYIATFGPAFFLPFLVSGRHHWVAIGAYLVIFDIINTFGHTNLKLRGNWLFRSPLSPLLYLFYSPEFHHGHHAYFNANYALFMPIWDYLFGTARTYEKKQQELLPASRQDFVFIGHNGGLGHLLTIPELCQYKVFDEYPTLSWIPLKVQFFIMHCICQIYRLFFSLYYCARFCIANEYVGRIIVLARTPWDYMTPRTYETIIQEIIDLMKQEHQKYGTRYFGLGNLNKMKQLNDGGKEISYRIEQDPYLREAQVRVWTGDTLTVASVYHQIADIPHLSEFFYIGAGGKVGTAVCQLLVETHPHVQIRIFSRNLFLSHPNISYSSDLSEMVNYRVVLVGKILSGEMYRKAFERTAGPVQTRFVLDYTVPAMKIKALQKRPEHIQHVRVGLLKTDNPNNPFLKGPYDYCMSHAENHIVPCHFGCILNTCNGRETNEVGDIDYNDVHRLWKMTLARGFHNVEIDYYSVSE